MLVESFFDEGNLKINKNDQKKRVLAFKVCLFARAEPEGCCCACHQVYLNTIFTTMWA